jgi:hypothetical protein
MKNTLLVLAVLSVAAVSVRAHEHAAKASKELEMMKGLAGDWKGVVEMDGKKVEATTSFRVTAGGSAVVETMGAGTPEEMTNVYHDVNGKLFMTHYCAMGNAPQMKVVKESGKSLAFESVKANGIDPKTTPHMRGVAYDMPDKDHLSATWSSANMGPEHHAPPTFNYERVK